MTDKTEAQPEALRVRKYIDRRSTSRGLDREHIHGFDVGDEAEALLLTSDLEAILGRIASLEAQLSARQAAPDGWRLVPELPTLNMLNTAFGICTENGRPVQKMIEAAAEKYAAMLSAAPSPPEREPLTDQEVLEAVSSLYAHPAARSMGAADDIATARAIERAHGIEATVENLQASLGATK